MKTEEKKKKTSKDVKNTEPAVAYSRWHLYIAAVVAALAVSLSLTHFFVPSRISAVSYELPDPSKLPDDNRLSEAHLLLEDQVYGPESIAVDHDTGKVFVGLKTGLICEVNIQNNKAKIVQAVRLTSRDDCDGSYASASKCGRPLGLRYTDNGHLIVVDAYLGLFAINWKNNSVKALLRGGAQITNDNNAVPVRYLNDLALLPDGRIILSESSVKVDDRDFIYDLLEHRPNGRILMFDSQDKSLIVLVDNLFFPNGVTIFKGQILIAEMGMARIIKYSPSRGSFRILIDNLPGYPDNIRSSHDGNIWVPLAALRSSSDNWLARRPAIRELIGKVLSPQALNWLGDYLANPEGLVLKVHPESGEIIDILRDTTGKITAISMAIEDGNGGLLLGNDANFYLGRLELKD